MAPANQGQGGGSRLQRLLRLVDGGSTPETRRAAAAQIAGIARAHPAQLPPVLAEIAERLRFKDWEARVAAAHCLGLLAEHFQHHTPHALWEAAGLGGEAGGSRREPAQSSADAQGDGGQLAFGSFSIGRVVDRGTALLASAGEEFEASADPSLSRAENLSRQRTHLKQRLGLGGPMDSLVDTSDIFGDEDLLAEQAGAKAGQAGGKETAAVLLAGMSGLSARERAAAMRRAKSLKRGLSLTASGQLPGLPAPKQPKGEGEGEAGAGGPPQPSPAEEEWESVLCGRWPFQALCDQLCVDVLDPRWEVRHGAAAGLREVMRSQAGAAGVHAPVAELPAGWSVAGGAGALALGHVSAFDAAAAAAANAAWLEDCAIHLLCVLALDRFGDYVSDQVVAPVRETAAQALGLAARPLPASAAPALLSALRTLAEQPEWEVRHGGLLGLKYALAAREEAPTPELLAAALPAALVGLQDGDDDVRAMAAEALTPVAALLAGDASPDARAARDMLWELLLELEDLSPATGSVMGLLAAMAAAAAGGEADALPSRVPRLFPFLRHGLTSVRLAAVRCLGALLQHAPPAAALPDAEATAAVLRLLFQNLLLERGSAEVVAATQEAWRRLLAAAPPAQLAAAAAPPTLAALFSLAATPPQRALDASLLLTPPPPGGQPKAARGESLLVPADAEDSATTRMRLAAAQALGQLAAALGQAPGDNPAVPAVLAALSGPSATGRLLGAYVATCWARCTAPGPAPADAQRLAAAALEAATAPAPVYEELAPLLPQLRGQASALLARALAGGVPLAMPAPLDALGAEGALALVAQLPAAGPAGLGLAAQALATTAGVLRTSEAVLGTSVAAALALAVVTAAEALPPKLNALVQPLVAAVRREPAAPLQDGAAAAMAGLVLRCADRTPCPNDRIIRNVAGFALGDPGATPSVAAPPSLADPDDEPEEKGRRGKASAAQEAPAGATEAELAAQAAALARRGGEAALREMAAQAGPRLMTALPRLWDLVAAPLAALQAAGPAAGPAEAQAAVNALCLLAAIAPSLHPDILPAVEALLPLAGLCLAHPSAAAKAAAGAALAALASAHTAALMPAMLRVVTPLLEGSAPDDARLGGVVALREVARGLGLRMVPYALLTVVPLMGRMSDPSPLARGIATRAFADVVGLMPLAQGVPPPPGLDAAQRAALEREASFLCQLVEGGAGAADFALPTPLLGGAVLRRYQQEGINWLAFLRRFGLHGVLADDMGLGKTLQSTSIIAAATHEARQRYAASLAPADAPRPSLIVCPSSLVAHWPFEIGKFVGPEVLRPLQYHGTPPERAALRSELASHDVVVMSYETLRADVEWVASVSWCYCVLDEGHAIRNPAGRIAQAAKRVPAQHRLILSGTPIQNNVLELWSLFDFLMPGFLGSQRRFQATFGRALAAQRAGVGAGKPRAGAAAAAEAGLLALDGLHRQVMPFILRRTKDAVLSDLPPKTVQDVMCDPSPLQAALYRDFAESQALAEITGVAASGALSSGGAPPHVFQSLHYLRRLASHPLLVLDPALPAHAAAVAAALGPRAAADWPAALAALRSGLEHAPKLAALRELLIDAGIGREAGAAEQAEGEDPGAPPDAGHRCLVFAQLKGVLDLAESAVLGPLGATSLRIDGDVDAAERFRRVQRFNADPTIDVMLLTTAVGGLGLNLTAADTVVFLEHDWNPMRDLQAMDRAHRLGQRRAVNVYRLLLRGTVEEAVMSLQRFKLDVAAAVVNQDNVSLGAMDTASIVDLFTLQDGKEKEKKQAAAGGAVGGGVAGKEGGLAAMLSGLAEGGGEEQYAAEFDLDAFRSKLQRKS